MEGIIDRRATYEGNEESFKSPLPIKNRNSNIIIHDISIQPYTEAKRAKLMMQWQTDQQANL